MNMGYLGTVLLILSSLTFCDNFNWYNTLEEAQQIAKKENKDIYLSFDGSDWCIWCIKLNEKVYQNSLWAENMSKNFVGVHLDFPSQKKISPKEKTYNDEIARRFQVEAYPTVFLLDADGKPYAKGGYRDGSGQEYIEYIQRLQGHKKKRDDLYNDFQKSSSSEEKARVLDQLIFYIQGWKLEFAYLDLLEQMIEIDQDGKLGLQERYALRLCEIYEQKNDLPQMKKYLKIAQKHSPKTSFVLEVKGKIQKIIQKDIRRGLWQQAQEKMMALKEQLSKRELNTSVEKQLLQEVHYYLAVSYQHLGETIKSKNHLKTAYELDVTSSRGRYLENILEDL